MLRKFFLALSTVLWVFVVLCYWLRPDSCTAVTIWPAWTWLAPGLLLAGLGWRGSRRYAWIALIFWILYTAAFVEEPRSIARSVLSPHVRRDSRIIRIISLNCAGGASEAVSEVAKYKPDIVLLQESPSKTEVEQAARKVFGKDAGVVYGVDASILVKGDLQAVPIDRYTSSFLVIGRHRLQSGAEVYIASTRLIPAVLRIDLWSPGCWRDEAENRRARREQVGEVIRELKALPPNVPLIFGGDMNAPQGDAVFCSLRFRLRDTFLEGGRGWGNTILNDMPVLRIDQIWASKHFKVVSVISRKTKYSDHRMVICDIILADRMKD